MVHISIPPDITISSNAMAIVSVAMSGDWRNASAHQIVEIGTGGPVTIGNQIETAP